MTSRQSPAPLYLRSLGRYTNAVIIIIIIIILGFNYEVRIKVPSHWTSHHYQTHASCMMMQVIGPFHNTYKFGQHVGRYRRHVAHMLTSKSKS